MSRKVHLYTCGIRTLCNSWECGSKEAPAKFKNGDDKAEFAESYKSVDILDIPLGQICKLCFNDGNSQHFCKVSGGIINIVTYDKAAIAVADELSSDGDSCLTSFSE